MITAPIVYSRAVSVKVRTQALLMIVMNRVFRV